MLARKSVTQRFKPTDEVIHVMEIFRTMTNICIGIGLKHEVSTLKQLSLLSYPKLATFQIPSCYKLCAISKASGFLASRNKSIKRGYPTKDPYQKKLLAVAYRGFKITNDKLRIPLGSKKFLEINLTPHTLHVLSESALKVNSLTLTEETFVLCISKEVEENDTTRIIGVDRNLINLTVGNNQVVTYYDLRKVAEIAETSRNIIKCFKRNDVRIRRSISSKYSLRRTNRRRQILHVVSKRIVDSALKNRQGIAFEDIREIHKLYRKGNGQGHNYRARMNSWPYDETKRQIEYKAQWAGVPVIHLTKSETRGTSQLCPKCGERLQSGRELKRKLWCQKCRELFDRDLVAVLNISRRGRVRFARSKGEAVEAMVQEPGSVAPVILKVDASKLAKSSP